MGTIVEQMKEKENKISEFEDRTIKFTHSKQRREKQMNRTSGICGKISKDTKLILSELQEKKKSRAERAFKEKFG